MIHDLCWERHLWEIQSYSATEEWRAPSFSWASVEGNIFYNDNGLSGGEISSLVYYKDGLIGTVQAKRLAEVLEARSDPISDTNQLGQVRGGFVRLHGSMIEASIHDHTNASPGFRLTHVLRIPSTSWIWDIQSDTPLKQVPVTCVSNKKAIGLDDTVLRAPPGQRTAVRGARVWLLNLGSRPVKDNSHNEVGNTSVWLSILILGNSVRTPGAYERVGFTHILWPPWGSTAPHLEYESMRKFVLGEDRTSLMIV